MIGLTGNDTTPFVPFFFNLSVTTEATIFDEIVNDKSIEVNIDMVGYNPDDSYGFWDEEQLTLTELGAFDYRIFKNSSWFDFFDQNIAPAVAQQILFNTVVDSIDYSGAEVIVKAQDGQRFSAEKVIFTAPLKVLQDGDVTFVPELPQTKLTAINETTVWDGIKVFLEFTEKFYPTFLEFNIEPRNSGEKLYYDAAYGQNAEAIAIKAELDNYLKQLNLTLSPEKTLITHAREGAAKFLGYEITTAWDDTKLSLNRVHKARNLNGSIQLRVPREIHTKWMQKYTRNGKPHYLGGYIELSDFEIVQTFGAHLRGLVNYYALADNLAVALSHVRWACMESVRKTLTAKHKIRHKRKTYRLYYHNGEHPNEWRHIRITIQRDEKPPLIAKCGETPLRKRPNAYQ